MSRRQDALKAGAVLAACAVCCPAVVVVPLGLLGGLGAGATATTAVLGAPLWLLAGLMLLTTAAVTASFRRQSVRRRQRPSAVHVTAAQRPELPLTDVTGPASKASPGVHTDSPATS